MRNTSNIRHFLPIFVVLGGSACGDDPSPASKDTNTQETAVVDTVTPETTPEVTPDVTETIAPNACEPNPCDGQAAACNAEGKLVTYPSPGQCTVVSGVAQCRYTASASSCPNNGVCAAGACVLAGDVCDYAFDERASFVTAIAVGDQGADGDACCFDFTGDGAIDNNLGKLLQTASTILGQAVNVTIAGQIADGTIALVLETRGVTDIVNDPVLELNAFDARTTEASGDKFAGAGEFSIDPSSFFSGTTLPVNSFPTARIANGRLRAGPNLIHVPLPVFGADLNVAVSLAEIEGKVGLGPNGVGLTLGADAGLGVKLGGVIRRSDLYAALNAFMTSCGCLEYVDPADTVLIGEDGECNAATTDRCGPDVSNACIGFPTRCGILLNFIQSDVDMSCLKSGRYDAADCSGIYDGISIGLWMKATSAIAKDVQECQP